MLYHAFEAQAEGVAVPSIARFPHQAADEIVRQNMCPFALLMHHTMTRGGKAATLVVMPPAASTHESGRNLRSGPERTVSKSACLACLSRRVMYAVIGILPGMFEASLPTHFYLSGDAFSTTFE